MSSKELVKKELDKLVKDQSSDTENEADKAGFWGSMFFGIYFIGRGGFELIKQAWVILMAFIKEYGLLAGIAKALTEPIATPLEDMPIANLPPEAVRALFRKELTRRYPAFARLDQQIHHIQHANFAPLPTRMCVHTLHPAAHALPRPPPASAGYLCIPLTHVPRPAPRRSDTVPALSIKAA